MDTGEVFLSCNNLTLEQYRTIVLSRALTGTGGCAVSIAVLVIILLTTKRKVWENLTKRVYLANIFYTLIALFHCGNSSSELLTPSFPGISMVRGHGLYLAILWYTSDCSLFSFQVTLPVYQAVKKRKDGFKKANFKLGEVFLYLILFLCPFLNSWEPFLPQLPSYGNYGPLCWFRLELTDNCTYNTLNEHFLPAIPFAVACFGYSVLTFTVSLTLCGIYCRFHMTTIGGRIVRVIPTVVILIILPLVVMVMFIVSAAHSNGFGSFPAWLTNVTLTTAATIGMLMAVGIYVHLPTNLCEQCGRASHLSTGQSELQPVHPPEHSNSTETRFSNPHSTVTTETTPLITHASKKWAITILMI